MDLNQVAVFVKVVKTGSFSEAARQTRMPVSTLSNRVARLERELATTLLKRTTRKLSLTPAGELFYQLADGGINQLLDAKTAIATHLGELCGVLRITTLIDLGDHVLSALIDRLYQRFPKIQLDMVMMSRHADLINESFDAAIRIGQLKDSSLMMKKIGGAQWGVFAGERYLQDNPPPQTPQDLVQHRCLQFSPHGKTVWTLRRRHEEVKIPMPASLTVNDILLLRHMVTQSKGIALLPLYQNGPDTPRDLIRILPQWTSQHDAINLVYPRQKYIPAQLRAFIDVCSEVMAEMIDDDNNP